MAGYARSYQLFKQAGIEVIAVSVDPPERSAAMRRDLEIEFPVLSDLRRETITRWGLLNTREKGGIAFPATFLIDRALLVRFSMVEDTSRRVPARAMLAFVKAMELEGDASAPIKRRISPGYWFIRAIAHAFRHGVRVRRT
ncbi:MAG: peroxiredoxin family protein [Deltaproteobacteria bacterium]|nr:peroxiredoxin family protein [Deltaproteobacteria bacterium]